MENLFVNITLGAPTTTVVCPKPCILSGITINKAAANAIIAIYDNASAASGTVIGTITMPATLLASQLSFDFHDIVLQKGLTIVTTTAQDITVAYRVSA